MHEEEGGKCPLHHILLLLGRYEGILILLLLGCFSIISTNSLIKQAANLMLHVRGHGQGQGQEEQQMVDLVDRSPSSWCRFLPSPVYSPCFKHVMQGGVATSSLSSVLRPSSRHSGAGFVWEVGILEPGMLKKEGDFGVFLDDVGWRRRSRDSGSAGSTPADGPQRQVPVVRSEAFVGSAKAVSCDGAPLEFGQQEVRLPLFRRCCGSDC